LLSRFAWGGERIDVEELEVPETLSDVPLLLTAQEGSRYSLADHEGTVILEGSVGALAVAGEGRTRVALLLSELVARPGTQFFVTRRSEDAVVDQILNSLQVEESGKSKDSGVLTITLVGGDPARLRDVLNAIAGAYLRQNVERRSAEAAKTLEFLEGQLPQLKANVEKAENALNAFKTRTGTLDPTAETKNLLDRLTQIEKQIGDAEVKRSELRQSFTGQHPALVSIANTIAVLRAERAAVAERIRAVPQAELSTERLARGLKDATEIYVGLLNKAQELRVAKSGTIGDVTIIDRAYVPSDPVKPQRRTILLAALLLGLVGGVAAAVMRRSWVERADSPEEVENATGLPVFVTVPHSDIQEKALRGSRRRRTPPAQLLAESSPDDPAVEAVRSLRTTLRFALVGTRNVVAFSGPAPAVGKSFLAMNLAHVLSATGSSVLLVDADLRRGWLHRQFGFDRAPGLSDVLSGSAAVGEVIRKVPGGLLSVLPTGSIPPNPAELLSNPALEAVLRTVSARYDLVIIDTPPVLAVTDAMLVARFAGVNFLVVRAGRHTHREIALAVKEFTINRVRLHGIVMNDMYFNGDRNAATGYIRYSYSSDASD
jgi:tyrosine-protein kinase Etk/Wzc